MSSLPTPGDHDLNKLNSTLPEDSSLQCRSKLFWPIDFWKKKSFSLINSCVNICPSPCGLTLLWVHDFNKLKSTIPEVDSTYLFVKWFLRIRFFNFSKNFTTNPNHLPKKTMYPFYFNKRVSPLPLPKSALVKIRPMVLEKKLKM